jgi:type I restriction enzyme, S subunit
MMTNTKYKQTEIGLIPEDWEVIELGKILIFGSGKDYKHLKNGEIPVYGTGGLMTLVDNYLYNGDSVGIGRKGTIDKPVFLQGKFWTVDTLFYTHSFLNSLPKFIYYQFCRVPWKEYNEASGVPSLNKNTLEKIKIPLPPLPEQQAIAAALSDADAYIESLELLLEKKRLIKQGAMQELLRPKEGWEEKKLGEVCASILGGGTPSRNIKEYWGGKIPWMTVKDFATFNANSTQEYITDLGLKNSSTRIVKAGKIIVATRIALGQIVKYNIDVAINQDLKTIDLMPNYNSNYLIFYYQNIANKIIEKGSGSTVLGLSLEDLKNIEIAFPTLAEQTRIATILSDMDAELVAIGEELEKARQLKQGMMQELLTGKIRFV